MNQNGAQVAALFALLVMMGCDDGRPRPDTGGTADAAIPVARDAGSAARDAGPSASDAGEPRCEGVARSCSLLSSASCATQAGCRIGGECSGSSTSCYSLYDSYACSSQAGCFWSSSARNCSGSARSCYGYTSSSGCSGQRGCYWNTGCEGVVTSCILLDPARCEGQLGCYLR